MTDQLRGIRESIDALNKSVAAMASMAKRAEETRRTPVDVDMLTSDEIAELERLIAASDVRAASSKNIEDPAFAGMYAEFSRLGLALLDFGGACVMLTPTAAWAVEKRRQRDADTVAAQERQWRHERRIALAAAFLGGAMGIVGTLLGVVVGHMM